MASSSFFISFLSIPSSPPSSTSSPSIEFINKTQPFSPSLLYPSTVLPSTPFAPLISSLNLPLSPPYTNTIISSFIDSIFIFIAYLPPFLLVLSWPHPTFPLLFQFQPTPFLFHYFFDSSLTFTSSTTYPLSSSSSTSIPCPPYFLLLSSSSTETLATFILGILHPPKVPFTVSSIPSAPPLVGICFEGSLLLGWVDTTARRAYKNKQVTDHFITSVLEAFFKFLPF